MEDSSQARLVIFLTLLLVCAAMETQFPRRALAQDRVRRWWSNLGIVFVGTAVVRLLVPIAPVSAAIWAQTETFGLFNVTGIPVIAAGVLSFLALDATIYWQHRLFHRIPLLWRIHRMHHTDTDIDVTSGLRFHPIELVLSILVKVGLVVVLGAPALAVVVFEVVLNATSLFNHSRLNIPHQIDQILRLIVVTPDMHRVHHSIHVAETDSNFGFNIPWWDRWFGTYVSQPKDGHEAMALGLPYFRGDESVGILTLLAQPFRSPEFSDEAAEPIRETEE